MLTSVLFHSSLRKKNNWYFFLYSNFLLSRSKKVKKSLSVMWRREAMKTACHTLGMGLGPWRFICLCCLTLLSSLASMYSISDSKKNEWFVFLYPHLLYIFSHFGTYAGPFDAPFGPARYNIGKKLGCRVLPNDREIAYSFCITRRKRKHIEYKTTSRLKAKRTSIAQVQNQCPKYATYLLF
jgi:hypothetical protein